VFHSECLVEPALFVTDRNSVPIRTAHVPSVTLDLVLCDGAIKHPLLSVVTPRVGFSELSDWLLVDLAAVASQSWIPLNSTYVDGAAMVQPRRPTPAEDSCNSLPSTGVSIAPGVGLEPTTYGSTVRSGTGRWQKTQKTPLTWPWACSPLVSILRRFSPNRVLGASW